jgi:hypothetical protein
MADIQERLAAARKKAESLKSEIAKAQSEKKDCAIQDAAAKKQADLKSLGPALKHRRVLKGHFGKVYAMHWSGDNVNLVSASQVRGRRCNRALILARKQKNSTAAYASIGSECTRSCIVWVWLERTPPAATKSLTCVSTRASAVFLCMPVTHLSLLSLTGRQVDHMERLHNQQGAGYPTAQQLGDDLRL